MKIAVAGMGYVGLSNALLLSQHNEVAVLDVSKEKVLLLNSRKSPIKDAEIEEWLQNPKLILSATVNYVDAFRGADYIIIATPTDYDPEKNFFNTSSIEDVIGKVIETNPDVPIVIKSTVPVGYTEAIRKRCSKDDIIFVPEFLREGKALYDNLYPSRIIIGDTSSKGHSFAELLVDGAIKKDVPVIFTKPTEAEAIKLFANTYLALRVAYFNEMDSYAEVRGLDVNRIIKGVCLDPRIGDFYNNPSFGYGGYCLPKDTKQLLANYRDIPQNIITAIVEANRTRKEHVADMILERKPEMVGVYRLTMKQDSDNFRMSAIHDVIRMLQSKGTDIIIYEPMAKQDMIDGTAVTKNLEEFKKKCDVIVANRWNTELEDVREKVYTRDIFRRD